MSPGELEAYLHEHIPLSRAMQVSVTEAGLDGVVLHAPLAPNINHRETVFGGSASAVAILAAWSLLHLRLRAEGLSSRLVIHANTMEYDHPIAGGFTAGSRLARPEHWPQFLRLLARHGKARAGVDATLVADGRRAGRFDGSFVALGA